MKNNENELKKKLAQTEAILSALHQGELDAIVRESDIALIRNETLVRNTEYALEETRNNFKLLFDTLNDLLFIIDTCGKIIHFNPSVQENLGYSSDDLKAMNFVQLHAPVDQTKIQQILSQNAHMSLIQNTLIKKNNDFIYAETSFSRGLWSRQAVWFAIVRDITIRKQAEMEMKAARKAAEDANKAKTVFFAKMTHELRTPLNGILGYTQMLINDKLLNSNHQKAVSIIQSSGEYLLALINDLLDFSKLEAQQMKINKKQFALRNMVQHVSELTVIQARQKNIAFSVYVPDIIPEQILGDEKRLQQILLNILGNAIKFTEKGSVRFELQMTEKSLRFQVKDTGCGIPDEKMELIFKPFHSGKNDTLQVEGTGLGLYISRVLVRMMGSDLHIESQIGQGTTVWFDLPGHFSSIQSQEAYALETRAEQSIESMIYPPDHLLKELMEYTLAGDISGITQWINKNLSTHTTFHSFFQTIKNMALKFKLSEIQAIVQERLKPL